MNYKINFNSLKGRIAEQVVKGYFKSGYND